MNRMATKANCVEVALQARGLRGYVDAIDNNPNNPGEVVLWAGMGYPVHSVREAIALVRAWRDNDRNSRA